MQLTANDLDANDLDALRRAIKWGEGFQRREPGIQVLPQPMPDQGTPQWVEQATRLAAMAQADSLHLKPWQCEPAYVHDDGAVGDCYGRRPDEVALHRKMKSLGISIYEPDPPAAIARAEHAA